MEHFASIAVTCLIMIPKITTLRSTSGLQLHSSPGHDESCYNAFSCTCDRLTVLGHTHGNTINYFISCRFSAEYASMPTRLKCETVVIRAVGFYKHLICSVSITYDDNAMLFEVMPT